MEIKNSKPLDSPYTTFDYSSDRSSFKQTSFITGPNGEGFKELKIGEKFEPKGINNLGQVIGSSAFGPNLSRERAFITGPDGEGITNIGTYLRPDGGMIATYAANGINDLGEVVGVSRSFNTFDNVNDKFQAFLYSHGGLTDLSSLDVVIEGGWTELIAVDINNHGQIVGYGKLNGSKSTEAFLLSYTPDTVFNPLSPIPEPSTYAMLLVGLGMIGFSVRRRRV